MTPGEGQVCRFPSLPSVIFSHLLPSSFLFFGTVVFLISSCKHHWTGASMPPLGHMTSDRPSLYTVTRVDIQYSSLIALTNRDAKLEPVCLPLRRDTWSWPLSSLAFLLLFLDKE